MNIRQPAALAVVIALAVQLQTDTRASSSWAPGIASASGVQQPVSATAGSTLSGTVLRNNQSVPDVRLRLRNIDKNSIVGRTVTDPNGRFSFLVPESALYLVEAVDRYDRVLAVGTLVNTGPAAPAVSIAINVILPTEVAFASAAALLILAAAGAGISVWTAEHGQNIGSPER
jgi:hypothetical protein